MKKLIFLIVLIPLLSFDHTPDKDRKIEAKLIGIEYYSKGKCNEKNSVYIRVKYAVKNFKIESLKMNKPSLYLKYLHENTVEYEEFESCWTINSDEELKAALFSLQHEKEKVPYSRENVNRFLSEIIYGGREKRDVLLDYEQFIISGGKYHVSA